MAIQFPTALDDFTNPQPTDSMEQLSHSSQHADCNNAIEALEAKVGIDGSAVMTSHDYKLSAVAGSAKAVADDDSRLTDARTPIAHAASHKSGGSDAIKLDELAAPTDVTTLNVSTSAHGLCPKAPNDTTQFLRGDATWGVPSADPSGFTTIVKSANQDVTNAGLTDDSELRFPVEAGGTYLVELLLAVAGNNTTGDYAFDLTVSAGTQQGWGTCQNLTAGEVIQNILVAANGVASTTTIANGTAADLNRPIAVRVAYAFTASADATMKFRFGNFSVNPGRTSRTWKGSILRHKKLN